jgi:RNA polymerase sigma-70 factor (ECF subfamily)
MAGKPEEDALRERSKRAQERSLRGCADTAVKIAGGFACSLDPAEVARINDAMRRLSPIQRDVLMAVRLEDCSYAEIAHRMEVSVSEVEELFASALSKFLRILEQSSRHWWRRWLP